MGEDVDETKRKRENWPGADKDRRIRNFKELEVYKNSFELQQDIFHVSKEFPVEEKYSLTDQVRRSSRSIGANLAEAWHKRMYIAHFLSKLTDSDAEQAETQHWLRTASACGYLSSEQYEHLIRKCQQIGKMLGRMIENPNSFCRNFKR